MKTKRNDYKGSERLLDMDMMDKEPSMEWEYKRLLSWIGMAISLVWGYFSYPSISIIFAIALFLYSAYNAWIYHIPSKKK